MLAFFPVAKLSMARTRSPRRTSSCTIAEPIKPAAPVTKYKAMCISSEDGRDNSLELEQAVLFQVPKSEIVIAQLFGILMTKEDPANKSGHVNGLRHLVARADQEYFLHIGRKLLQYRFSRHTHHDTLAPAGEKGQHAVFLQLVWLSGSANERYRIKETIGGEAYLVMAGAGSIQLRDSAAVGPAGVYFDKSRTALGHP